MPAPDETPSPAPERRSLTVQGKISFVKLRNYAMYRALAVNRVILWFCGCSGTWEANLSRRIWAGGKPPLRNVHLFSNGLGSLY